MLVVKVNVTIHHFTTFYYSWIPVQVAFCWDLVCKRCRPWQDLNLHTTRRDLNPQFLNPKSNAPSMKPRAALPLSYMVAKHSGMDSSGVVKWLQPCSTQTWLTCAIWWKCLSFSTKIFCQCLYVEVSFERFYCIIFKWSLHGCFPGGLW